MTRKDDQQMKIRLEEFLATLKPRERDDVLRLAYNMHVKRLRRKSADKIRTYARKYYRNNSRVQERAAKYYVSVTKPKRAAARAARIKEQMQQEENADGGTSGNTRTP